MTRFPGSSQFDPIDSIMARASNYLSSPTKEVLKRERATEGDRGSRCWLYLRACEFLHSDDDQRHED